MRLAFVAALILIATPATARVVTPAQVRYATQDGNSEWHKTEVTLMKGSELNTATRSYNYAAYDGYAMIWFSQDQVAVIRLSDTIFGCSREFEASCIPRFGNLKGKDQGGREWEICTAKFC